MLTKHKVPLLRQVNSVPSVQMMMEAREEILKLNHMPLYRLQASLAATFIQFAPVSLPSTSPELAVIKQARQYVRPYDASKR